MSLKEEFLKRMGKPITIGDFKVVQFDRIPTESGLIQIKFLSGSKGQGIALKVKNGSIKLSDGKKVKLLHVWFDPLLPMEVTHRIQSENGELKIWNIYEVHHPNGSVTTESWTLNAGMVVDLKSNWHKIYRCSDGNGEFDPSDLEVEVILGPGGQAKGVRPYIYPSNQ